MKKNIIYRPILLGVKQGHINSQERKMLRERAWEMTTDNATYTVVSKEVPDYETVLFFDVYMVEQLSFLKRLRHSLRVFKATIAGYIGIQPRIVIIALK